MDVEWVRHIHCQCNAGGIPFFWETTDFDDEERVKERKLAEIAGISYAVQKDADSLAVLRGSQYWGV